MKIYRTTVRDSEKELIKILKEAFSFSDEQAKQFYNRILPHINRLKRDVKLLIETEYIDKVYRDSYYSYFSTKLNSYQRNCIRVSLFDSAVNIEENGFWSKVNIEKSQENDLFLGFFVIRPALPNVLGRSIISPKALRTSMKICQVSIPTTAGGVKYEVSGFPHASQDQETNRCAEVSLWAVMEYFGNKYPEYKTILPTTISKILKSYSPQRQIPTEGLSVDDMAFVLKKLGFGTQVVSLESVGKRFFNLISCYVESGIPVIVSLISEKVRVGHSAICIGYSTYNKSKLNKIPSTVFEGETMGYYMDYDDIPKSFVFIDDNLPIYQIAPLKKPTRGYNNASAQFSVYEKELWKGFNIAHFVVPLHPRIYLNATMAKHYSLSFIFNQYKKLPNTAENPVLIRVFLTSSRTYKHYVALSNLEVDYKEFIINQDMPKFTWICELSYRNHAINDDAVGLIILDATEVNVIGFSPLILYIYNEDCLTFDKKSQKIDNTKNFAVPLSPFKKFDLNLQ